MRKTLIDIAFYEERVGDSPLQVLEKHRGTWEHYAFLNSEYRVIVIKFCRFEAQLNLDGIEFQFLLMPSFFRWTTVLKRLLNKLKPDFVLSHSFQFPLATIRFNAVLGNEIPHIIQLHSDRPTGIVLKLLLQMWAYKRTTAFLFTGVEQANGFKKQGIISSNAKVIDCMEGSSSFIPLPRVKLESPTKHLLWVGGLIERKDPFCFIRALSILKRDGLDFQARMVFQTVELKTEVIAAIETEGLGDCIDLVGSVPKQEMQSQYQWAEYFVSTSRHEGSGWALCEAMSMRVIPVVSNIPSHKYMTGEGEFGSLFELGNDSELASILRNLFHGNRDELSRKARQGFDSRLSFQAIANTISNALINL